MNLRRNITANSLGMVLTMLAYFFAIPIYLRVFGQEVYGLIAVFFTLTALSALLDFGLGANLARLLSFERAKGKTTYQLRAIVAAHEKWALPITLLLAIAMFFLMPDLMPMWIKSEQLSSQQISNCALWIGLFLTLQMPIILYSQALMGLRFQVALNWINTFVTAIRLFGVFPISTLENFRIEHFFLWFFLNSLVQLVVLALYLRRRLPHDPLLTTLFVLDKAAKKYIWTSAIALASAMLLIHLDKFLLSSLVELKLFGYYSLAWTIASLLLRLIAPVNAAVLPALTAYVAVDNWASLRSLYFKTLAWSVLSVGVFTIALLIFAPVILLLYTGSQEIADQTTTVMRLLLIGTSLHAIASIMFILASAHGWMMVSMITNLVACLVCLPVIYFSVMIWGIEGAAGGWIMINVLLVMVGYFVVQKKCIKHPPRRGIT